MSDTSKVLVVRIGEILPHPNADKLELTMIGGFQVVIGKGNFKTGDLAVYIQPDSVVPQTAPFEFIWGQYAVQTAGGGPEEPVPAKRRRITVKRLRKEYSEGLLMPIADLNIGPGPKPHGWEEGDDVAQELSVTRYIPENDVESTEADTAAAPKRRHPKTLKGWFYFILYRLGLKGARKSYAEDVSFHFPEYDVDALKNAGRRGFQDGEPVTFTEKIHGSNARFVFILDDENNPTGPGRLFVGSHYQWKKQGDNVWWNAVKQHPFIEEWCVQHPGLVLYAEVGPTQAGYRYGAGEGEAFIFPFDVWDPKANEWYWPGNVGVSQTAPILYVGPYSKEKVAEFVDGPTVVNPAGLDKRTLREGIVISSRERRLKLKVVSNQFYEKDGAK